jgi:hypothetical protein
MKEITLCADEALLEAAQARAREEHTTLNEQFRIWLETYSRKEQRLEEARALLEELRSKVNVEVRRYSRDEMNER